MIESLILNGFHWIITKVMLPANNAVLKPRSFERMRPTWCLELNKHTQKKAQCVLVIAVQSPLITITMWTSSLYFGGMLAPQMPLLHHTFATLCPFIALNNAKLNTAELLSLVPITNAYTCQDLRASLNYLTFQINEDQINGIIRYLYLSYVTHYFLVINARSEKSL